MPKKSKRGGQARAAAQDGPGSDEDGSVFNDAGSVSSFGGISEVSTVNGGAIDGEEASSEGELFESKMKDAMDLATEKAAATRIKGIDMLCNCLLKRYVPDFTEGYRVTITDIIEKSLKKGKGGEITVAARLALILGVQLIDATEVYQDLHVLMLQMVSDNTQSASARAAVGLSVCGLCFIAGGDIAEVVRVMKIMESVYNSSSRNQENSGVYASCLSGWALLSTLLSSAQIYETIDSNLRSLRHLLSSPDVELRITAGETIAVILEAVYDHDEDYVPDNFQDMVGELKQLATDSSKSKSKKDRKEQRSSFRDVLRAVEEGEQPSETIKFGKEVLRIETWYTRCQYDWFCKMMGTGMNTHLSTNLMLREIFQLGPTLNLLEVDAHKLTKSQRNAVNQQAFKMRTQQRSKHRDKRSAVF